MSTEWQSLLYIKDVTIQKCALAFNMLLLIQVCHVIIIVFIALFKTN